MSPKKHRPAPARPPASPKAPRTDWDNVSDWYDQHVGDEGSEFHREVVLPGALRLLEIQPNQRIIDIACGQGVLCRKLQTLGVEVTGVDAADQLIAAARQRSDPSITYHTADVRDLSFLPQAHFDSATCLLAIQNIHPIQGVFDGVGRLLKPW